MKPSISFHRITRIELSSIEKFEADAESGAFVTRALILTDEDGEVLRIPMFANTVAALVVTDREAPVVIDVVRP